MSNWKQHIKFALIFILVYIIFKLFVPQYLLIATILISFFIANYITRHVISENWIAKVVRFILGKDF
jgi:hypothetical protein